MARLVCVLVLLLALLASPARADDAADIKVGGVALAGFGFLASIDMLQTAYCHGARTCVEKNPLVGYAMWKRGVVPGLAIKGAVHTTTIYALSRYRKKSPRAVKWAAIGLLIGQGVVDVHNYRQLKRVVR